MKHVGYALLSVLSGGSDSTEALLQKVVEEDMDSAYLLGAIRDLERGADADAAEKLRTYADILDNRSDNSDE